MKSFFRNLSSRFPFFANRPSALERAVRTSPKSRRLRMEPLENRALLAVDAFGVSASLAESNFEENWGPDPAPAAFSASVLATDAEVIDVSGADATLADSSFSVQNETPELVAPPSFDQLMESLGMIEIESLGDESDVASLSYLDEAASATQLLNSLNLQDISQGTPRQVVFYDSSAADFDASTLNLDDESVYYVDAVSANADGAESYSVTPRSGGGSSNSGGSGGSSSSGGGNSGGTTVNNPSDCHLTTYGSSEIFESATFTGSGGSDHGPYFGFTTPVIPSGYSAYVMFGASDPIVADAVYGQDYLVKCATIDESGVVTPNNSYVSGGLLSDGTFKLTVYGSASYSIVPISDSLNESFEGLQAMLYLVDMQSGGANYDPTPINCGSFNAVILDDGVEYYYETTVAATDPIREVPPAETNSPADEWTRARFVLHYEEFSGEPVDLEEVGLLDDYQRAILDGNNFSNWEAMERNSQAAVMSHLRQEIVVPSIHTESVRRNVTDYENLYVYGNGFTNVVATSTPVLVETTEIEDSFGLLESTKTYNVVVNCSCTVSDRFADPYDTKIFGWTVETGRPYDLTGSWSTSSSYQVTVTTKRIEVGA